MTLEEAKNIFKNDLYATELTGAELTSIAKHSAQCTLRLTPSHRNAMGNVMGGVFFTLADLAFAAAANSECNEILHWVSLNSQIHYLTQPKSDVIEASATCIKQGKSTCVYEITIRDSETQKPVAIVTTTGLYI